MIVKNIKGIWFYGLSGSGKTLASNYLKKKIRNSLLIDGDIVRKYISKDLGYNLLDRKIQISRVFGIAKLSIESKIFPIASTVFMNEDLIIRLKKEKILAIKIVRNIKNIRNRDKIYKKKLRNVVGVDIKIPNIKRELILTNNSSINVFFKELKAIL